MTGFLRSAIHQIRLTVSGGALPALAAVATTIAPVTEAGPMPGAVETFPSQANANAWGVYDFADGMSYYPVWFDEADPYIGLVHAGDAPLWFYATVEVAQGAFVGDYASAGIRAIGADLFIDSGFDFFDCVVYTDGPLGWDHYYSPAIFGSDHPGGGWVQATFWLDEPWYYWSAEAGQWVGFLPDAAFLSNVAHIGFEFFPLEGDTGPTLAALDNVVLVPTVAAPRVAGSLTDGQFSVSFTPLPGTECDLLRFDAAPSEPWQPVPGHQAVTGPAAHEFTTAATAGTDLFRVIAYPHYTPVVTQP